MKLLILNTATSQANVILKLDDKVCAEKLTERHSESVLPKIEELLSNNDLRPKDINYIAVVVGPGSFTGIRVGISIVKAMMQINKALKGVSLTTLELIRESYSGEESFTTVMNALSGKFYIQKFGQEPKLAFYDEIADDFKIGLKEEDLDILDESVDITEEALLKLSLQKIENGKLFSSNEIVPLYLRNSQAEENYKELKFEAISKENIDDVYNISKQAFKDGWTLAQFEDELESSLHFGYVLECGSAVGYIVCMETEGELGKDYNILSIAVSPKYLRKGFGKKLLEKVEERAKQNKVKKLWLEVKSKNLVAIEFYKNFGFSHIATRKKYYKDGDDALILEKIL